MARGAETLISDGDRRGGETPARVPDKSSPDDALNRAIIEMLREDGRMPYSEIAQALDVSEGTIRNRVTSMKRAGLLRIVAIVDPVVSEYQTQAMLGIKIASGHTPQSVADRLMALPDIVYILWVSGRFDLLIEVASNDQQEFLNFLQNEILGQTDIASCETMTGLQNFKNQFLLKRNWTDNSD